MQECEFLAAGQLALRLTVNPQTDFRPGLRPPQFSLRTLLLLVTLCAVVFALVNVLPPLAIAGLIFLALTMFVHVAGNAIGSRLRDNGNQPVDANGNPQAFAVPVQSPAAEFAPPTQLGQRRSLGRPALAAAAAGLLAGGAGGGIWTALCCGRHVAGLNIAVGAAAFSVLGGIAAFLAFSFVRVGAGALRQALSSAHRSAEDGG